MHRRLSPMEEPRPRPNGFTLVEILAAIVLLATMALSIMNLYAFGTKTNALLEEDLIAANLMQYKIEEIKCQPFSKDVTAVDTEIASFSKYRFDVTQTTPYYGSGSLKEVDVACRYTSAVGVAKVETIRFVMADRS